MTRLNPGYVLAPLDRLLANCQSNVMLGLRIVEGVEAFPPPTAEEVQFLQLSFGGLPMDFALARDLFRKWVLMNGFKDVYKAIRLTLERLFVFKSIHTITAGGTRIQIVDHEKELRAKTSKLHYPQLIDLLTPLLNAPFKYREHVASYNAARNCLEHTNGILTERHCNNPEKNKLIIRGNRFRLFFKRGDEEVPAEIGRAGPENAALMLGAEGFQIELVAGPRKRILAYHDGR